MRELKFRAWDNDRKRYCVDKLHMYLTIDGKPHNFQNGGMDDIYTIEQFTGLHDKNGKEIYEGDFLGDDKGFIFCTVEHVIDKKKARFGWGEDGYSTLSGFFFHGYSGSPELFKVIGNIHENPELMK